MNRPPQHRPRRKVPSAAPSTGVAMGFVSGMLSGAQAAGIDRRQLLERAGLGADDLDHPSARVALRDYARLYNVVVADLEDEAFALFPVPMAPGSFEFLCRGVLSSRNLREGLARTCRFLRLVVPGLRLELQETATLAELRIHESGKPGPLPRDPRRVFAYEWVLRLVHALACWLAGRELALDSVAFPYPRPRHADDYQLIYTAHPSFDAPLLVARFNRNLLELPVRRDEDALNIFLQGAPGKISVLYRRDRRLVLQVRDLVRKAFPESLTLRQVAQALNLSTRTVHRRLQEENASLRSIKDGLRRDIALARLEKSSHTIAEIASDLGYSDPSSFFRAVSAWTGAGPQEYRRRRQR